jgi:hypothetical protein
MARQLEDILVSDEIPLTEWDPEGDEWVKFQRPTRLEGEELAEMQARSELVWSTAEQGQVAQRDRTPLAVLESAMVAMCLVDSSLKRKDEPVFVPGTSCRQVGKMLGQRQRNGFYKAWHSLPDELAEEIIAKLREWHPPFDWRNPEEGEE